jgi:hypothetical protein
MEAFEFAVAIAADGAFFHASEDSGFFEGFAGSGGGAAGVSFDASFGESPAAGACAHEKEFNSLACRAITNGGNVFGKRLSMTRARNCIRFCGNPASGTWLC